MINENEVVSSINKEISNIATSLNRIKVYRDDLYMNNGYLESLDIMHSYLTGIDLYLDGLLESVKNYVEEVKERSINE